MSKVIVPIAPGCEEIEAVSIVDVLRRAEIEVTMAAVSDDVIVTGANGITFKCDATFSSVKDNAFDMIVLPGGYDGVDILTQNSDVQNTLKAMKEKNLPIAAVCAAPIALARAGVLPTNYTCYPGAEENIRENGFQSDNYMVIKDSNVITSRGPGTSICFALQVVKLLKGDEAYNALKNGLLATYCEDIKEF